jgi:putative ABC transport system permease protein
MHTLIQDIRYGLRTLMKRPGFTVVAVLALTLGIGANTAIFSVIHAVILRPLPYDEPERLMVLDENSPAQGVDRYGVSYPNFLAWRDQNRTFEGLAALRSEGMTLTGRGDPAPLTGTFVSPNLFDLLGAAPVIGRTFLPDEDRPGGHRTVLVSYGFWQQWFGGNPNILGQAIVLDGTSYTIIGVMPSGFRFPYDDVEVWWALGSLADEAPMKNRTVHFLQVLGRLKPEGTLEQARAEMNTIAARIQQQYPGEDPGHGATVLSLHEQIVGEVKPMLLVLLGAVGFVLLIACANVAHLLLARAATRRKEMGIRAALGASRGRTIRQLLTESLLLALFGGLCGLVLALWGVDVLVTQASDFIPRAGEIGIDSGVLGFTLLISLLTGILFGLIPALQSSKPDLNDVLKDRSGTMGSGNARIRHALVVAEVALSLLLLIGAGLMLKSFQRVLEEDPGFRTNNLLLMTVSLPHTDYPETQQVIEFYRQLSLYLEALPGVRTVSAVNALPISGGDSYGDLTIENRPFPPGETPVASYRRVLPNYFRTIGIPLLRGREFNDQDTGAGQPVVTINAAMARRYFPNEDPVGKRIKIGPPEGEPWLTIVGVVGDVRNVGLDMEPALATYEPHPQRPWRTMNLVIRTDVEPASMAATVRNALRERSKGLLIYNVSTMDQRISASMAPRRLNMTLLGIFAVVALMLAVIGIYGVMSYAVTQRTHEIGVRVALGAQRVDVLRLVVGQAMILALVGVAIGLGAAVGLTRLMTGLLYKVSATDPITYAGITAVLLGVALLASYIPARRASRVDPMTALRWE